MATECNSTPSKCCRYECYYGSKMCSYMTSGRKNVMSMRELFCPDPLAGFEKMVITLSLLNFLEENLIVKRNLTTLISLRCTGNVHA